MVHIVISIIIMTARRVTANLPGGLLDTARKITGKGITETIVEGLQEIRRRRFYERALALQGKLRLRVDVEAVRGRRRR